MKSLAPTDENGFTLIELLIVISIIVILMGLLFPAFKGVQDQAKRVQAKNDVTQIVTAVNAFYTEYGKYPVASTITTDAFYGTLPTGVLIPTGCANAGTNEVLFNILRGIDTTNNPRAIVFISPKVSPNARSGIAADNRYYDPWGTQYAIVIDSDYNNQIVTAPNPYSDADGSAGPSPLRLGAIAYSYGKNGKPGGGAAVSSAFVSESGTAGKFKSSSDILSWQ